MQSKYALPRHNILHGLKKSQKPGRFVKKFLKICMRNENSVNESLPNFHNYIFYLFIMQHIALKVQ